MAVSSLPLAGWAADDVGALRAEVDALRKAIQDAAEWRRSDSLVHLAGYGAVGYAERRTEDGSFNISSFSPIFHYQYKDLVMLEAELELGYDPNGTTETILEYMAIDLFLNDYMTLVGGQFLSPIGQFRQNLHPAWINKLPSVPLGFADGGAAPLADIGVQLRGGFPVGARRGNYAVYLSNGPRLVNNAGELEVETEGHNADENQNKTVGGRLGFLPLPKLALGLSGAFGKANISVPVEADRDYRVIGADFSWTFKHSELRGEYVNTEVGALASSLYPEKHVWKAWYAQGAHRFGSSPWQLVLRYGEFQPPGAAVTQTQTAVGINYLFANNAMAKFAYEFNQGEAATSADENRWLAQLAFGF